MQLSLPLKRLLWKDGRQLLPLVVMLLVVTVVIQALFVFSNPLNSMIVDGLVRGMLIVIPMCYVVGAGAVLIGQENESGQMLWLNGLPIQGNRIATSKLVAAGLGWLVIWIASLVVYELIQVLYLNREFHWPRYSHGLLGVFRIATHICFSIAAAATDRCIARVAITNNLGRDRCHSSRLR